MKQKVENLADGIKLEKVYFPGEYFLRGSGKFQSLFLAFQPVIKSMVQNNIKHTRFFFNDHS